MFAWVLANRLMNCKWHCWLIYLYWLQVPLKVVEPLDHKKLEGSKLSLSGDHQFTNAALAVSLCKCWLQRTGNWEKIFQNVGFTQLFIIHQMKSLWIYLLVSCRNFARLHRCTCISIYVTICFLHLYVFMNTSKCVKYHPSGMYFISYFLLLHLIDLMMQWDHISIYSTIFLPCLLAAVSIFFLSFHMLVYNNYSQVTSLNVIAG